MGSPVTRGFPWPGWVRYGGAGKAWQGLFHSSAGLGTALRCWARLGLAWLGMAWVVQV